MIAATSKRPVGAGGKIPRTAAKANDQNAQGYHPVTRWLHAGLVLSVIFQLACTVLMTSPNHKRVDQNRHAAQPASTAVTGAPQPNHENIKPGAFFMQAHRTGGIVAAVIVLANLIWALLLRGRPRKRQLFVLFSLPHWREALSIARNIPWILLGKRPLPELGNALSLVFEMLGLLIMSTMAITGSIIWGLWQGPGNHVSRQAELLMQIHTSVAPLLLLYLSGHITMATMHARGGDPVFSRILPFGK